MKTKTGKLLMMQVKAKSNQSIPAERFNSETTNTEQNTPAKPNISQESLKQNYIHNQANEEAFLERNSLENQLIQLRHENMKLCKEIQTLRNQLHFSNTKPEILSQQTQTHQTKHQQHQQPFQTQKSKKNHLINSQQKQRPQSKLKQKCSALQVQNYRLIENNYLLLLKLKKNLKLYKESLGRIVSKIQALQFSQAAKEVYDILSGLKNDQLTSDEFQRHLFPNRKEQPTVEQSKAPIESIKPLKFIKLAIDFSVYNLSHYEEGKIQNKQNNIQIKLNRLPQIQIPKQTPQTSKKYSSFHLINSCQPDPEFAHHSNNKLFNSQIRDYDYQKSGLDQVSLHDKIQSDWDHSARKQPTIYKCHGNSTELYKMLMLQAMTIEAFFV